MKHRKLMSWLLVLAMLLSVFPTVAFAEATPNPDNGELTIAWPNDTPEGVLTLIYGEKFADNRSPVDEDDHVIPMQVYSSKDDEEDPQYTEVWAYIDWMTSSGDDLWSLASGEVEYGKQYRMTVELFASQVGEGDFTLDEITTVVLKNYPYYEFAKIASRYPDGLTNEEKEEYDKTYGIWWSQPVTPSMSIGRVDVTAALGEGVVLAVGETIPALEDLSEESDPTGIGVAGVTTGYGGKALTLAENASVWKTVTKEAYEVAEEAGTLDQLDWEEVEVGDATFSGDNLYAIDAVLVLDTGTTLAYAFDASAGFESSTDAAVTPVVALNDETLDPEQVTVLGAEAIRLWIPVEPMVLYEVAFAGALDEADGDVGIEDGVITLEAKKCACEGDVITLTVTPATGYELATLTATYTGDEGEVVLDLTDGVTENDDGTYSFTMPAAEVEIGATFTPITYTITYDLNDGEGENATYTGATSYTVATDADISLTNPTWTGHTFLGWTGTGLSGLTKAGDDEATIFDADGENALGDKAYTAHWEEASYAITYELAGGVNNESNPASYTASSIANAGEGGIVIAAPTKEGSTFAGWAKSGDGGSDAKIELSGENKVVTIKTGAVHNVTLTANWTANKYNITGLSPVTGATVTAAGTTNTEGTASQWVYGETVTITVTAANGYKIDSVSATTGDDEEEVPLTHATDTTWTFTMPADDVAVAVAMEEIEYTITYDLAGGVNHASNPATFKVTTDTITLGAPTKEGYAFTKWTNGVDDTAITQIAQGTHEDVKLVALWSEYDGEGTEVTVTFDSDEGSAVAAIKAVEGNTITEPVAPTKAGSRFLGWYVSTDDQQTIVEWPYTVTANVTLKAKWEAETYTVTYWTNGGSAVNTEANKAYNAKITKPTDPTRTGYTFGGWYTDEDFLHEVTWTDSMYTVTADADFYAKWTPTSYTISYTVTGGTNAAGNPASYTIESDPFDIAAPTLDAGMLFNGWTLSGDAAEDEHITVSADKKEVTIGTGTVGNLTLTAAYVTEITYTFVDGGNMELVSVATGGDITPPADPESEDGLFFAGWFTTADGDEAATFTAVNENATVYAQWGYALHKNADSNGNVSFTVDGKTNAFAVPGRTVTIVPASASSYLVKSVSAVDADGGDVEVDENTLTFTMPEKEVIVTVSFEQEPLAAAAEAAASAAEVETTTTGGSSADSSSAASSDTETTTNADGSTTTTSTAADGTVTETTTAADGSKTETVTRTDGSSTETTTTADGTEVKTETAADGSATVEGKDANGTTASAKTDADGNLTEAKAEVTAATVTAAVEAAAADETPVVTLPVEVPAAGNTETAASIVIDMPASVSAENPVKVEIPVEDVKTSTVVVIVKPDGTEELVKDCTVTADGVVLGVEGDVTVKVIDNAKTFSDKIPDWAADEVNFVTSREIFNGNGDGTFNANQATSRGMVAQVLFNFDKESGNSTESGSFGDAAGKWYDEAASWANAMGVVQGSFGQFNGDNAVSRQDLATMLYRYANARGFDTAVTGAASSFSDAASVAGYAASAMQWCVEKGIINGIDGALKPTGSATRGQVAAMMARFVKNVAA